MALGGFCCCKHLKPRFQEEKGEIGQSRKVNGEQRSSLSGRSEKELKLELFPKDCTLTSGSLNLFPREGAELADRIVARTRRVRFLVGFLNQLIEFMGVPANTTCAKIMHIYKLLKIIKIGGQDMDPRFQFVSALFGAALESFKCGLLMYILLADMPWPIVILCVLMAFAFIAN